ncbi:DUF559 domain-containing protein [Georgenia sp. 311]|uniref:DUF559 domain-containing protein n=1 Tax=Georgenia sp. 311 TaxID=2585134 RepID=UPI0011123BCC|nr:DUF559 domain-containing protein [Georgenia sp. 311]TNC17579.1 DUF559 domain-containing protein [Georgenia sp. 311]
MDVTDRIWHFGGAAKRSQLVRTAADRRALADGLATGVLRELGAGWLATAGADPAVVAARRLGGTVTCVSAAAFYGLRVMHPPERRHVALPRARGVRQVALPARVHRERWWSAPPDLGLPLAPLDVVLARVLRCLPADLAAVTVDSALTKRLVTTDEVARAVTGPGSPAALAALARCRPGSRSGIETLARLALEEAGLRVDPAVTIAGVGEVDLVVEGHVVVECDGFAYHSGRVEYREDRRRDRVLIAKGYLPLRFTYEDVMTDSATVVRAVLEVLGRA